MQTCPSCAREWPEDRFRPEFSDCFACRAKTIGVTYGYRGRQQFHDVNIKEYNDRQVAEARANGADPVPAVSATTAVPTKRLMDDLKKTSLARTPKKD